MKKIKFKERVENAHHAFFYDEDFDVNDFLICRTKTNFCKAKNLKKSLLKSALWKLY